MIVYPSSNDIDITFGYIEEHCCDYDGSIIDYHIYPQGIEKLYSVIELSKNDEYYPTIYHKAAYLFSSIIEGHFFENGNKRLAVYVTFILFVLNNYTLIAKLTKTRKLQIQSITNRIMRNVVSDERIKIEQHGFLYGLALYIAGGKCSFEKCKHDAYKLFSCLIRPVKNVHHT